MSKLSSESFSSAYLAKNSLKKISVFAGHYGSGKTQIAVNYAIWLRNSQENVLLADLDIVNPYFRTADAANLLKNSDIRLISSELAGKNSENPSFPPEVAVAFDDNSYFSVLDVGGDDRGAIALGRFADKWRDAEFFFVVNTFRPLTADVDSIIEAKNEIEKSGRFKFTAVVNNSNLGDETTVSDILSSVPIVEKASAGMGLRLAFTAVNANLSDEIDKYISPIFPLTLFYKEEWAIRGSK